jgi:short-subunit dehydrogenase involved in D-alanine esterification of teichoic acids
MNKKTIWITGGSTGIGKALAIKFAKRLECCNFSKKRKFIKRNF